MSYSFSAFWAEVKGLPALVQNSAKELRRLSSLTSTSMLLALNLVLHQFLTLFISSMLRITFGFLTVGATGMLFGPVMAGVSCAIGDVLKYFIRNDGGTFFPGFTLVQFVAGFLYGLFLYKKPVSLGRVFLCKLVVMAVVSLWLDPLLLTVLYGKAFWATLPARLLKCAIMLPIETAMLYTVLKTISVRLPKLRV